MGESCNRRDGGNPPPQRNKKLTREENLSGIIDTEAIKIADLSRSTDRIPEKGRLFNLRFHPIERHPHLIEHLLRGHAELT